jgi:hypothetical protein
MSSFSLRIVSLSFTIVLFNPAISDYIFTIRSDYSELGFSSNAFSSNAFILSIAVCFSSCTLAINFSSSSHRVLVVLNCLFNLSIYYRCFFTAFCNSSLFFCSSNSSPLTSSKLSVSCLITTPFLSNYCL